MLFAAIDLGSNASRLLFANVFDDSSRIMVDKATLVRIPTRLGEDVFHSGAISIEKADNLVKTLTAYKLLIEVYKPLDFTACATAALREASNGEEVLQRIMSETGIPVRMIDGLEEASIIRHTNKIEWQRGHGHVMYIDVGGGSTEISVMSSDDRLIDARSFRIGTLRLLSKAVREDEWALLKGWLKNLRSQFGKYNCVGSGGNINKLNKMYGDPDTFVLSYLQLKHALTQLEAYTFEERIRRMGLRPDRADVIVPAARIFIFIMKTLGCESILVPRIGLADGLVYQLYEGYRQQNNNRH
ncbi:MAG: Ppx/GppA family phosphatase [Bacteroidales bacterium]|nr:Ppx/GppA family phosphatase [Bacteroidales bacterium]